MRRAYVLFALLGIAALSACSNPFRGGSGDGSITIAFGSGAGRLAVTIDDITNHEITLIGGGGEPIIRDVGASGSVSIPVSPGTWTISIRAYGDRPGEYNAAFPARTMLRAVGLSEVEVTAGENTRAVIQMISATEAANHAQLYAAINMARTDYGREKIIVLMGDIAAGNQYTVIGDHNITFIAYGDTDVIISRAPEFTGTLFSIYGALNIGRPGSSGTITIAGGDADVTPEVPLIEVSSDARLVINQELRLTGNRPGEPELEERFPAGTTIQTPFSWPRADAPPPPPPPPPPTPTGVTIEPGELLLALQHGMPPQQGQLTATVQPLGANQAVIWSSSNPAVAAVDQNGRVTAVSVGTAVIRAASAANSEVYSSILATVHQVLPGDGIGDFDISFADLDNNAPELTPPPISYLALSLDGEEVALTVTGAEFINIRWFLDGIEIIDEAEVSLCRGTLTLDHSRLNRIGTYRLTVEVDVLVDGTLVPFSRVVVLEVTL